MKFMLLIPVLVAGFSTNIFASAKVCGEIQQEEGSLTFIQRLDDGQTLSSSIYGKDQSVTQQLSQLVGFREVCVEATSDESDVVVIKVLSRDE